MSLLIWLLLLLASTVLCQNTDQTRIPGATGSDVVEAVVNLIRESCIFPPDKLFLRRLAFVKTVDGTKPNSVTAFSGGIWQVNATQLNKIKSNRMTQSLFPVISSHFGINWNTVSLSDLTKPLYSGIAASLFMSTLQDQVPRIIEKQSAYYAKNFDSDMNAAHHFFITLSHFRNACSMKSLDLVFLVGTSSSLSMTDFLKAKDFASKLVDGFSIGPNAVQISFVTFSTNFKVHFYLKDYQSSTDIKHAIANVPYAAGATQTGTALDFVSKNVFTLSAGSRPDASKVIILITDGRSTDHLKTVQAADDAKHKGILIFAIGVGNQTLDDELNRVATKPSCTHVIKLHGYNDLNSLRDEIQQASCKAPTIITPGNHSFNCQQSQLFRIPSDLAATTMIVPTNGKINIYGSFFTPTPSKAFSDFHMSASPQTGAVVFVTRENKTLYLNVTADIIGGCTSQFKITFQPKFINPDVQVTCIDKGIIRTCSLFDILKTHFQYHQPPYAIPNPCTPGQASFKQSPHSSTEFVYCPTNGTDYVFLCPPHHIFSPTNLCIPGEPPSTVPPSTKGFITAQTPNTAQTTPAKVLGDPCTKENIANQKFFHPYPPDPTKYIDCTNWPDYGIVKSCPPHKKWDQADLTCIFNDTVIDPILGIFSSLQNICKHPVSNGDLLFFPHPTDRTKYIQCDEYGDAFLKTCPNNKYWVQNLLTCVPHGLIIG